MISKTYSMQSLCRPTTGPEVSRRMELPDF